MSIQIPKGDNLGWGMPQARRTAIQGGDDPVGQTLLRSGRDLGSLGININKEQQQKQEQQKNSLDRVAMANNAMDYQKEINLIIKDANDKVNAGKLQPEQVKDYVSSSLSKVNLSKYTPPNLSEANQALFNLHLKELDNSAGIQAERLQEKGIGQKAKTTINQYINNANEAGMPPDQFMASTKSDDFKRTASLVWGISAPEQIDNINRKYTVDYLQNQAIAASDKGDYKALRQLRADANNPDFYKGVLQQDDRVRLGHQAKQFMKSIENEWKATQAQSRADLLLRTQNAIAASKNGAVYADTPSKEEYIKVLGQDKGTMQYEAVQNWQKYGEFITDYSQMSPDEINTKVDALKPQDNDRGYAAKDAIYEAAKSAKNQILTQRLQQPFVAAVKAGFYKPITSANPDDITNEITRRYAAQDELHKLGINAPLLSNEEASPLSENIKKSTNIDGQMALLRNLGAQLPPDALKGVAAQIAPNSGAIAFSALILNTPDVVNNQVARINAMDRKEIYSAVDRAFNKKEAKKDDYLVEGSDNLYKPTIDKEEAAKTILQGDQLINPSKSAIKEGIKPVALPSDAKLKESFDEYVGNAFSYNPQAYQFTFNVFKSAYAGLAYKSNDVGDIKTDAVSSNISKRAALMATGGITKNATNTWTNKRAVVMPYGMDESTFKDRYKDNTIKALKEAGLNHYGVKDAIPISSSALGTYILMNNDNGRWIINPKTGEPITVEVN